MLRAAIYGLGRWGMRLVDSVQDKSGKIRFVRGISRDPAKLREFSEKTRVALVSNFADVLSDPQVDAVVLATPHSLHHGQIVQAARAGKHVFVEKPFTLTRATAEDAVHACRSAGITLAAGFNRRYAPSFVELMRRVRAGEIGDVLHVEGQHSGPAGLQLEPQSWRASRAESPGGAMTARGVHALDAMIHIAGLARSVYALSGRREIPVDIDDTTSMLLEFAGGATGYLGSLHATGDFYRVHAFGSKGWLEVRGDIELIACGLSGPRNALVLPAADKERAELEAFADAAAAKVPFVVPSEELVNGVAVLEAIAASAASGRPVRTEVP